MNWSAVLGPDAWIPLLSAGVRLAMPLAVVAAGLAYCQRAGLLFLSVDGAMVIGSFGSFLGAYYSGNPWIGILAGITAGILVALAEAFLTIVLNTDQVVNGIALFLFGHGLASFLNRVIFGIPVVPPRIDGLESFGIPLLSDIPGVGTVLFRQNALLYAGLCAAMLVWWMLERTSFGLSARSAGERPEALDASGGSVASTRWLAMVVAGGMAGLGGSMLVVGDLEVFLPNLSAGKGWIAIALVIFARWKPLWVIGGAALFGVVEAFQLRVQAASGGISSGVPFELFQALPYVVTIVAMWLSVARSKRSSFPSALGAPYPADIQSGGTQ